MPRVWVIKDKREGTGNQAISLADALGYEYEIKELDSSPFAKLPNFLLGNSLLSISETCKEKFRPPWPEIVISAGRRAALISRYIKIKSQGGAFICQIMHPGYMLNKIYDMIILPNHDERQGKNIVNFTGSPNRITKEILIKARDSWRSKFNSLERPITSLIVGGSNKYMKFGEFEAQDFSKKITRMHGSLKGSIVFTTSRRTGKIGKTISDQLRGEGCKPSLEYFWGAGGDNPYMGILAYSDYLVVSGDSISMLSEACASPGGVYIYVPPNFNSKKHKRYHEELYNLGAAKPLKGVFSNWDPYNFNPTFDMAEEVKKRISFGA